MMDAALIAAISGSAVFTAIIIVAVAYCAVRKRREGGCRCFINCKKLVKRLKLLLSSNKSRRDSEGELKRLRMAKTRDVRKKHIPQLAKTAAPYGTVSEHFLQVDAHESLDAFAENCLPEIDIFDCNGIEPCGTTDSIEEVTPLPSEEGAETFQSRSFKRLSSTLSPKSKLGRSKSAGEYMSRRKSFSTQGIVKFYIAFREREHKLYVEIKNLTNLYCDTNVTHVCLKLHLLPKETTLLVTSSVAYKTEVDFDETFEFGDFYNEDLAKGSLRIVVYGKEPGKTRDRFIGEVFCQLAEVGDLSEIPTACVEELKSSRLKKKSTSDKFLLQELGQLFIHLQYQPLAQRMKVVVRRGDNLPKRGQKFSVVIPDHYVIINFLKKGQLVRSRSTRFQNGFSPVWNEAFLFDLPSDKEMSCYSFDLVLMRGKIYKKDDIIGHVAIGPNTSKAGIAHWDEALMPRALETARWHDITPVIVY